MLAFHFPEADSSYHEAVERKFTEVNLVRHRALSTLLFLKTHFGIVKLVTFYKW